MLVDLGNTIWSWFGVVENRDTLTALLTALGFVGSILAAVAGLWLWLRKRPAETARAPNPTTPATMMDVESFLAIRKKMKADLQAELIEAEQEKRAQLLARIAELEAQIANPEEALAEAQARIADLEALLDRAGNRIGADRVADARAALEIDRETIGVEHPEYATRLNNLARLLEATGRYDEAEPLYREAPAVFGRALGADHPDTQVVREYLEAFLAKRPD